VAVSRPGGHPAPPEGDGRTRRERSLPQRIAAAKASLQRDKDWLRAVGRDIAHAQGKGRLDEAERLAGELPAIRESIANRTAHRDQLEAERRGQA